MAGSAKKKRDVEEERRESQGIAGGVLTELGGMFPGLGGLIKELQKSEAFRERLKAIDAEVETRFREGPLKRADQQLGGTWSGFQGGPFGRTVPQRHPLGRGERVRATKPETASGREPPADVFDEGSHLRVVAELPGVEEADIKTELKEARLIVSAKTSSRDYHREINLPCAPGGKMEQGYRNGVLEITLEKG